MYTSPLYLRQFLGVTLLLGIAFAPRAHAQICLGGIVLTTQAEVNAFDCRQVLGDLTIEGNSISSLAGLSELEEVDGEFAIGVTILGGNNANLATLAGLEGLTRVGGRLTINSNAQLASLQGLQNLTSTGALSIVFNNNLSDCVCPLRGLVSETSPGVYEFTGVSGNVLITANGGPGATCSDDAGILGAMPACFGPDCSDPASAPSYAGGYVLNNAGTRAFIEVSAPAGAITFEFYNTSNLVVGDPETDTESGTPIPDLTRGGDTFTFPVNGRPTKAFFPITTAGGGTGVSFFLRVTDTCRRTVDVDPAFALTAVAEEERPGFALAGAQPNPASQHTTFRFSLTETDVVTLAVYDVLGREVARPVEGLLAGGAHEARLDASALAPGVYLYRLTSGAQQVTRTLTVAH